MLKRWSLVVMLLLIVPVVAQNNPDSTLPADSVLERIRPETIRAHMNFLADDLLEGRGTGTRGFQLAANYVRAQFEQMGLKPGGVNGSYFQNVRFRRIELVKEQSSLTIEHEGSEKQLTINKDFAVVGEPLSPNAFVRAQVVFVGYGVSAPEFNYDDYAGIDVRGKIVAA